MKTLKKLFPLLLGALLFAACEKDEPVLIPEPELPYDALVLHEGNYYNGIVGSLGAIDFATGKLTDGVFAAANQRQLGATPNDMLLADGKIFIAVTDENRVEVADAMSFRSLGVVEIAQPRCLCATASGVYVSAYDGCVHFLSYDLQTHRQSQRIGSHLEGIAERNGKIYVCNSHNADYSYNSNLVVLGAATLEYVKDLEVVVNPTAILSAGPNLFLLSSGDYAGVESQLQKIDTADKVETVCPATLFDTDGRNLFVVNTVTNWSDYTSTTEYSVIDIASGQQRSLLTKESADAIFSPSAISVEPSGNLLIGSYNQGSWGTADYSGAAYVLRIDKRGNLLDRYEAGVGVKKIIAVKVE